MSTVLDRPTYTAEADHLLRQYRQAVGYALQYGIKTYVSGTGRPGDLGPWDKPLGDLRDEIRAHERAHNIADGLFPPTASKPASRPASRPANRVSDSGMSPAYCRNGHEFRVWASAFMGRRGERARWGASPCVCTCGSAVYFGRP